MNPLVILALAWFAGVGLGLVYFGTLWLTIRQLPSSRSPTLLLVSSYVVRTVVVLAGFYLVMGGHWERILTCLVGFIMARFWLVSRIQPQRVPEISTAPDGS